MSAKFENIAPGPSSGLVDAPAKIAIGVDARLLTHQVTGVERMLQCFLRHCATSKLLSRVQIVLFSDVVPDDRFWREPPFRFVHVPVRRRRLQRVFDFWLAFDLKEAIRRERIEVFYTPHTKLPFANIARVVTVHGLEWLLHPTGYRMIDRAKQRLWINLGLRHASGIVMFAHSTRNDLRKFRPRASQDIAVIPEGVEPVFRQLSETERDTKALLHRYGVSGNFILSVCSLEPRKNIDRLIQAYAMLVHQFEIDSDLVLVGKEAWKSDRLHGLCGELGIEDRVRFTGYVSDAELAQFYNHAAVFVFPSLYEGFGLPVVEAMASGVPVVTSGSSSLIEVAGSAAVLVDPFSVDDISAAILRVLTDSGLRGRLVAKGLENASRYTWQRTADGILEFLINRVDPGQPARVTSTKAITASAANITKSSARISTRATTDRRLDRR